jgi:hypothetical protein
LLAYKHYYDDSENYDLPNLDTYDIDGKTIIEKVKDENDYFIAFWGKVSQIDYLELFDFLEYHFERSKDKYRYLAILKSRIVRLLKSDNNRIEKAELILDWVKTKPKNFLNTPSVSKGMTENEKTVINRYKFFKNAEKLSKRMAVLKVHKETSVPESTIYRYLKKYEID